MGSMVRVVVSASNTDSAFLLITHKLSKIIDTVSISSFTDSITYLINEDLPPNLSNFSTLIF